MSITNLNICDFVNFSVVDKIISKGSGSVLFIRAQFHLINDIHVMIVTMKFANVITTLIVVLYYWVMVRN